MNCIYLYLLSSSSPFFLALNKVKHVRRNLCCKIKFLVVIESISHSLCVESLFEGCITSTLNTDVVIYELHFFLLKYFVIFENIYKQINKDFYIDFLLHHKSRIMGFCEILCLLVLFPLRNVSLIERKKSHPAHIYIK